MGISARISFAIITVVLATVVIHFGWSAYSNYQNSRAVARDELKNAVNELKESLHQSASYNLRLASQVLDISGFTSAYQGRDRGVVANDLNSFINHNSFAGFVVIMDDSGQVFYSTETPREFGFSARKRCFGVDYVLTKGQTWIGPANFGITDTISLSGMVPMPGLSGIVAVNQPLSSDYLTGLATELSARHDNFAGLEVALYSANENKTIAMSAGLIKAKAAGIASMTKEPKGEFESDGRLWELYTLSQQSDKPGDVLGELMISKPVPDIFSGLKDLFLQDLITAIVAIVVGLAVAAGLSTKISYSLKFLAQRARDLTAQKSSLEPLDSLEGEFLELGELMDSTVSSLRATVQGLKTQMLKTEAADKEQVEYSQSTSTQVDALNRQVAGQQKQISDLSRQLNSANQQIVQMDQTMQGLLLATAEGFLFLDPQGTILSTNQVFLNWIGANEGEIAGRNCFDLVKKPGEPRDLSSSMSGASIHADVAQQFFADGVLYHRFQDKTIAVSIRLQPIQSDDSRVSGYIMMLRDNAQAKELDQLRQDIVHILSDSVRAPLAAAETTWHTVLQGASESQVSPSVGQALAQLNNHYAQMCGVVDSLLMMYGGHVAPPVVTYEPVVVTRLIADCLQTVAPVAQERKLQLDYKTVTGLPNANVDKETMHKVIVELLTKMISITAPGGRVRVENKLKDRDIRITITSSGPSLSQEEIQDMFVGFIAGKHTEDTYSSRLAMYLARNAVERLGGRIWAALDEEGRTVINFTMTV